MTSCLRILNGESPAGLHSRQRLAPRTEVNALAADLLQHYTDRTSTLEGKAMIVAMTRANCVKLYDALTVLPGCPEVKVVMTGNLGRDPEAWSRDGHITTKAQREAVKQRMIDPDDPLALVIVCDMWLTGTDIPVLHTLYIDKPMKNHNIIQAISRVNRVFRDKPHGLIVDYIGIGDELPPRRPADTRKEEATAAPRPALRKRPDPYFWPYSRKRAKCFQLVRTTETGEVSAG